MTLPEAAKICQELIRCGCDKGKGVQRSMQMLESVP